MSTAYTIRAGTIEDIATIALHRKRMWEDMGYVGEPTLAQALDPSALWFVDALQSGRYRHFFACNPEGQIIAGGGYFIDYRPPDLFDLEGTRAHVVGVYTEPAYRGQGIANAIMAVLIEDCRTLNVRQVTLNASDQGRTIYEKLGFEAVDNAMRLWLKKD